MKRHYSVSKWQNDGMIQICTDYYKQLLEETEEEVLSVHSVWGYLRHIPRIEIDNGYSKDVYSIANKCFNVLFLYCKRKEYISKTMTIEDFLSTDWYHANYDLGGKHS